MMTRQIPLIVIGALVIWGVAQFEKKPQPLVGNSNSVVITGKPYSPHASKFPAVVAVEKITEKSPEGKNQFKNTLIQSPHGLPPEAKEMLEETNSRLAERAGHTPEQIRQSLKELRGDNVKNPTFVLSRASDLSVEIVLASATPEEKAELRQQLTSITRAFVTANPLPKIVDTQSTAEKLSDGSTVYSVMPIHGGI